MPLRRGLTLESPAGPSPKTTESCRTAAPQARPAPHRPPALTGSSSEAAANWRKGGGARGASRGWGRGRHGGPFVSPGPAAHAGRRAEGGRDGPEGGPEPTRRALFSGPCGCRRARGAGCRTSGHDDRMTPPSLCFLSGRAGSPPPEATPRAPPEARVGPGPLPTPIPRPGTSRRAPSPSSAPLTLRGQECRSRARARRRRGGAGPRPPGGVSRAPWSGRRGPGAGRWPRWRCRRRGVLLCSCSSTERGRDTPELGKWEEGSEGGQRRRREDRRPRRLTLLAALARRHLTPPAAAGWADSEGDRDARREGLGAARARRWCSPSPLLRPRKVRGSRERAS